MHDAVPFPGRRACVLCRSLFLRGLGAGFGWRFFRLRFWHCGHGPYSRLQVARHGVGPALNMRLKEIRKKGLNCVQVQQFPFVGRRLPDATRHQPRLADPPRKATGWTILRSAAYDLSQEREDTSWDIAKPIRAGKMTLKGIGLRRRKLLIGTLHRRRRCLTGATTCTNGLPMRG